MSDFSFLDKFVTTATTPLVAPLMAFANDYWWPLWCVLFFLGFLLTLAPWQLPTEHTSLQTIAHVIRRSLIYIALISIVSLSFIYFIFDITFNKVIKNSDTFFLNWFFKSFDAFKWYVLISAVSGSFLRFYYFRFFHPWVSSTLRDFRNKQSNESESDIRTERLKYNPKSFKPQSYYDKNLKRIFLGLDNDNQPIYVPASTWLETNMMITGPTRYGKGVVIGCLMDQAIRRGDQLIYIDPKNDKFAAKIMLQTCAEMDRPFYYVSLSDDSVGYWSPFEGGKRRDAYNRLISIFGMTENSGDADFYKAMEKKVFNRLIKMDDPFDIEFIYKKVKFHNETVQDDSDKLLKIEAQLENWRQVPSLNPIKGFKGFSLEKAMLENAVIYFQGSLNDEVIKTATKSFILEVIQETMRLDSQRKSHLTFIIDEVRFLVSKTLADALATIVGFRVNIVTACQSINDLKTPDDINLDGEATYRSISTNSQLKLVYGGADSDTAEWVAKLSGTIVKQVTSMEKVTVKAAGAEEWDLGRTIKPLEEALIPENIALTLPPRVCVVFRPSELATVTFTSPVPVKDISALDLWLSKTAEIENDKILAINQEKNAKKLAAIKKIEEQTSSALEKKQSVEDDIKHDDNDIVDTFLDSQSASTVNISNIEPTTTLPYEKSATPTQFSVDKLIEKRNLDNQDLRWLFSKSKPNRFKELKEKDPLLAGLLESQYQALSAVLTLPQEVKPSTKQTFSIDDLLKKRNLSDDELRWLFSKSKPNRFKELKEKDSSLADFLEAQYQTLSAAKLANINSNNTKPQPISQATDDKTRSFSIRKLIEKRELSDDEMRWLFDPIKTHRINELKNKDPELAKTLTSQFKSGIKSHASTAP